MTRIYRATPDSRDLDAPRVLARVFPEPGRLGDAVQFYERLTGAVADMDVDAREHGMHLVAVGAFLLLELDDGLLDRSAIARETAVTVVVAHLDEAVERAVAGGATAVGEPFTAPTGRGARLRHPDGLLVEYVEHRPGPDDVDARE